MKNENKQQKNTLRYGSWTFALGAVVMAIIIVLNLIFLILPTDLTLFDLTSQGLYTLSKTTEELVGALTQDVTVTVVCETGEEDSLLKDTLQRYRDLSSHLKVEYLDPMVDPTRVKTLTAGEYDALLTDEKTQDNNSLIVHSAKRYCVIRYDDLGYIEYSPEELYAALMSGTQAQGTTYYNAENQITAAVDFVTADFIPLYYIITGHGETELSQSLQNEIALSNIQMKTLDLSLQGSVPADANGLIICNPSRDYTEAELAQIRTFLQNGGDMMLLTRHSNLSHLPNFLALMKEYGVQAKEDIVLTDNENYHAYGDSSYVLYFSPATTNQAFLDKGAVRFPSAHPILVDDELPNGVKASTFLKIGDGAYLKNAGKTQDSYTLAVALEAKHLDNTAKIVWLSSDLLITDDSYNVSGNNHRYFLQLMSYLSEKGTSVSINAVKMTTGRIVVSETQGVVWGILLVGVIPGSIALGGMLYYRKRRKR